MRILAGLPEFLVVTPSYLCCMNSTALLSTQYTVQLTGQSRAILFLTCHLSNSPQNSPMNSTEGGSDLLLKSNFKAHSKPDCSSSLVPRLKSISIEETPNRRLAGQK